MAYNGEPLCVKDFEVYLKKKLPKAWRYYINGGSSERTTQKNNTASWQRVRIRPTFLNEIPENGVDTSVNVFGCKLKTPICVTPCGLQCLAHEEGEVATVKGCQKHNNLMAVSSSSTRSYKDILEASREQLFAVNIDLPVVRDVLDETLKTVKALGFKFIIVNVDQSVYGNRLHEIREHFHLPKDVAVPQAEVLSWEVQKKLQKDESLPLQLPLSKDSYFKNVKLNVTWDDVDYLLSKSELPIVLKGLLTAEDAKKAVEHGVHGITVSNHGGRQLDSVPSTLEALPEVVDAVGGRIPVFVDGGIRLGSDVFKALALGARAVFIGRPVYWSLAYDGAAGVARMLDILQSELENVMALAGCKDVSAITRKHVVHESSFLSRI